MAGIYSSLSRSSSLQIANRSLHWSRSIQRNLLGWSDLPGDRKRRDGENESKGSPTPLYTASYRQKVRKYFVTKSAACDIKKKG